MTEGYSYAQRLKQLITDRLSQFPLDSSAFGGLLLMLCALAAMIWANSSWSDSYQAVWQTKATLGLGSAELSKPVLLWINDGLMAIFFLLVGLEIKREVLAGALSSPRKAALPVFAAIGGMAVPALIFVGFTAGTPEVRGWAIPAATDIAFALGIVALLGSRVPAEVKIFLTAVAVVDDLGAVLIIAIFYSGDLSMVSLLVAGACLVALVGLNRLGYRRNALYVIFGAVLWVAVLKSGIHATIAGVVLALTIPRDMLHNWEHGLHSWVFYGVMPIFALANAGVVLDASAMASIQVPVALGVGLGLVLGKSVGITGMAWLSVRFGWASLPDTCSWHHLHGAAWLAGIGFTMSLFITDLAFTGNSAALVSAKVGLLAGSLVAGVIGAALLAWSGRDLGSRPPADVDKDEAASTLVTGSA